MTALSQFAHNFDRGIGMSPYAAIEKKAILLAFWKSGKIRVFSDRNYSSTRMSSYSGLLLI